MEGIPVTTLILVAVALMGAIGVALGVLIALAVRIFHVDTDPKIEAVLELLPGANCGGCGLAGCQDFAGAAVAGKAAPNQCPVSSPEIRSAVARILGVEVGDAAKSTAVVLCGGSASNVKTRTLYNGVSDCVSASLVGGGPKSCAYGCLGLSSCARACPFNAIEIADSLAIVRPDRCVGCGKCVATCPRKLIRLVPASAKVDIYCSSPAKAPIKRAACAVPCIGCRKCLKAGAEGMFTAEGFKVTVNYANPAQPDRNTVAAAECPTGCLKMREDHLREAAK